MGSDYLITRNRGFTGLSSFNLDGLIGRLVNTSQDTRGKTVSYAVWPAYLLDAERYSHISECMV